MREGSAGWGSRLPGQDRPVSAESARAMIVPQGSWWLDRKLRHVENISRAGVMERVDHWRLVVRHQHTPWLRVAVGYAVLVSLMPLLNRSLSPDMRSVAAIASTLLVCGMAF